MTNSTMHQEKEELAFQDYLKGIYLEADRVIRYFVLAFFVFGVCVAPVYDTWIFALGIGGSALAAYFICLKYFTGTFFSRLVNSVIFSLFMLQFIAQMHGMYEMHFFFFINIAILIIYQDWRIMIPYAAIAVVHHSVFFILQLEGFDTGRFFISMDGLTWTTLFFHFGLVAVMAVVCGWWSIILHQRTRYDFQNKQRLELQLQHMQLNMLFADKISKGNLDASYVAEDGDQLGASLMRMRDGLKAAREKEEAEIFRTKALAQLNTILRKYPTFQGGAMEVLSKLANHSGAFAGALYLLDKTSAKPVLRRVASYAMDDCAQALELNPGEGLVGQAYLGKKMIRLQKLPAGYSRVNSGMGSSDPRDLLLIPIRNESTVLGIIELASLSTFETKEVEFLERSGEDIALVISSQMAVEAMANLNKELVSDEVETF